MAEKWTLADDTTSPESFLPKEQLKNFNQFHLADENTPPEQLFRQKSLIEEGVRGLGRTVARGTESVVGLPGDISQAVLGLANAGISKVTGKEGPLPRRILPTSQDVREQFTQRITRNLLEPESSGEETYDEVIGDAAPLLLGGLSAGATAGKAALRALGIAGGANAAKWATETVTGSPLAGAGVKLGSMLLAGTAGGRKELNKIKDAKYLEASENLPKGATTNVSNQLKKIQQIGKQVARSDNPEKSFIADRIKAFEDIVDKGTKPVTKATGVLDQYGKPLTKQIAGKPGGNVIVEELNNLKKGYNAHLGELKPGNKAIPVLERLVGVAKEGIENYGKTNPKFFQPQKIADELHGALIGKSYIQNIINNSPTLQKGIKNPVVKHLIYGGIGTGIAKVGLPKIAAAVGTTMGAREIAKTTRLLLKSPYARKYYKDLIEAGFKHNIGSMAKSINKLNDLADNLG